VTPEEKTCVRYRLERAGEALEEAKLLLDSGHLRTAVNRLYYACFYCVSALLLSAGKRASKHSGARALFDSGWVRTGVVPVALGRFYRRMFLQRQKADYADLSTIEADDVRRWLQETRAFVAEVSRLVEESLGEIRN